jgi:polyhydroxybutyrate depolymerase
MRRSAAVLLLAVACRGEPPPATHGAAPVVSTVLATRPYEMHVPHEHLGKPPLLVFLHGFGGGHVEVAKRFGAEALSDAHGFLLALPDGTTDRAGRRFWNASDACCNRDHLPIDDVAYLDAIIDDAVARYGADPLRVYVGGYSNGGFMAHRYACDRADRVAAIVSFAGEPWKDPSLCRPTVPVSVLAVHGDADDVVRYEGALESRRGDVLEAAYPGAREAVEMWAKKDGCAPAEERGDVVRYGRCGAGAEVVLQTLHGATHALSPTRDDTERMWAFLSAHSRRPSSP